MNAYDALGRLSATEEQINGVADPGTRINYSYDSAGAGSPQAPPFSNLLGRLTRMVLPSGRADFGYDLFGRINTRFFTDGSDHYLVRPTYSSDGRLAAIEFGLPDHPQTEIVKYGYDSAGRTRSIHHADSSGDWKVWEADSIDALGRVRGATLGGSIIYKADYQETGRRLPRSMLVQSQQGSRGIEYLGFDALNRETARQEQVNGSTGDTISAGYDALGRLASLAAQQGGFDWQFSYDALGNVTRLNDLVGSKDAWLSYRGVDRDRPCRITYGDSPRRAASRRDADTRPPPPRRDARRAISSI